MLFEAVRLYVSLREEMGKDRIEFHGLGLEVVLLEVRDMKRSYRKFCAN